MWVTTLNFIYALIAGLLPAFIWLYFWTREDLLHPEPRTMLAAAFLGGSLTVIFAIIAERYVGTLIPNGSEFLFVFKTSYEEFMNISIAGSEMRYVIWATIEEVFKFIAVAAIALRSRQNDEPIDAVIYSVTVALGFAALENLLFVFGPLANGNVGMGVLTGSMRFIGATIVHTVCSGLVGFFVGFAFYRGRAFKVFAALIGLVLASGLHAAFNLSIINSAPGDALKSFAWFWGAVVILIILFEEIKAVKKPARSTS
jgi:RsiW-degrading membrane proteinase PrsW (M82 family)